MKLIVPDFGYLEFQIEGKIELCGVTPNLSKIVVIVVAIVGIAEDSETEKDYVNYYSHYSDQIWMKVIISDFGYLQFEM